VLLCDFSETSAIHDDNVLIAWTIHEFDYGLMKLFFTSLL
jgi:hypothetical protein